MKELFIAVTLLVFTFSSKAQTEEAVPATQEEQVFTYVEQMPSFPGGEQAMYEYIKENIRYPEEAIEEEIEGRVYVKFIVTETGEIQKPESAKPADSLLQQEAIRLISSMPHWIPGKQNGRAVKVHFVLPVTFKLERETEEKD